MKTTYRIVALLLSLLIMGSFIKVEASGVENLIELSDEKILLNNVEVKDQNDLPLNTTEKIVYYEEGKSSDYGEGGEDEEHSEKEAAEHKLVTITQPGVYRVRGSLSKGQIAVDLGEDAKNDENAKVTLILDNVNINCDIAPAIIFYNVYECGDDSLENAKAEVDTKNAGANIVIADDSVNIIEGSYVARIYKEGTTKKLHKYDGAFYSKMSMNIDGEVKKNGKLYIYGDNEGLGTELHLTINGGNIFIEANDDAINTNEDGISVTTINDGYLYVSGGLGNEGDGIDSNGYLVINGGKLVALAHSTAGDGGIDADNDIIINGGTVLATGTRNDNIDKNSKQNYIELNYSNIQNLNTLIYIEDSNGEEVLKYSPNRDYQTLTFASDKLKNNETYKIYSGGRAEGINVDGVYEGEIIEKGNLQEYSSKGNSRPGGGPIGDRPEGEMEKPPMDFKETNKDKEGERPKPPTDDLPKEFIENEDIEASSDFLLEENSKSFSRISSISKDNDEVTLKNPSFKDMPNNSDDIDAVNYISQNNIMIGNNGYFLPDDSVDIRTLIIVLSRLENIDIDSYKENQNWFSGYFNWAVSENIITDTTRDQQLNIKLNIAEVIKYLERVYSEEELKANVDTSKYTEDLKRIDLAKIIYSLNRD